MDIFDPNLYNTNSQDLTFLDTGETDLIGGGTQDTDIDFNVFTVPSQSQTQTSQLDKSYESEKVDLIFKHWIF